MRVIDEFKGILFYVNALTSRVPFDLRGPATLRVLDDLAAKIPQFDTLDFDEDGPSYEARGSGAKRREREYFFHLDANLAGLGAGAGVHYEEWTTLERDALAVVVPGLGISALHVRMFETRYQFELTCRLNHAEFVLQTLFDKSQISAFASGVFTYDSEATLYVKPTKDAQMQCRLDFRSQQMHDQVVREDYSDEQKLIISCSTALTTGGFPAGGDILDIAAAHRQESIAFVEERFIPQILAPLRSSLPS